MASGRPIVASDIGGYRGVMTDGREGCLVPPKDPDALAAALERLLRDDELRARMGAAGPTRAREYSWPIVAGRVLDVYEETRERIVSQGAIRPRRRLLGRYLRRLSGLFSPIGTR